MAQRKNSSSILEKKIFVIIGILSFAGTFLCLSPNMTGNVIGQLSKNSSNLLSMIFLTIGIASIWIAKIKD